MDLLGFRLNKLDNIRIDHQVYIDWQDSMRSLKISSKAEANSDFYVIKAIHAVRTAIEHAKAERILATPLYLALPPSVDAMRNIVRPSLVEPGRVTKLELAGQLLSTEEKAEWKQERIVILKQFDKKI